ncbi:tRNA lysidine(34) synthetase TilS [Spiroplasma endosymbiont of Aspidapion aeneum]|uniref:tRNA lysidine(34) synthetase TilS n=1 Tax=Spiroplasma endosymbiont of Aspidapion aeneum TaxID=3066276 RepID=UPI00313D2703
MNKIIKNEFVKKKFVLGLSGGPDSIFLFIHLVNELAEPQKQLIACHINYNYRIDSNIDEDICVQLCNKYKIKLCLKSCNLYDSKTNFESWARETRYEYFKKICDNFDFDFITTAHNLNDFIETYYIQKERKTNVSFFGIKEITNIKNCKVYRPMLSIKKSEIIHEVTRFKKNGIISSWANDSTNNNDKFLRNKIRKKLCEKDFENIIQKIITDNNQQFDYEQTINNFFKGEYSYLKIDSINRIPNEKLRLKILFRFLQHHMSADKISSKKNRLAEILKQIKSTKVFLEYKTDEFLLVKDKNKLYVINEQFREIIDEQYDHNKVNFYKKYVNFINIENTNNNIKISNNWIKYKKYKINNSGKTLNDAFKFKQISKHERYKYIFFINSGDKIINWDY